MQILSLITFLPLLGAVIVLLIPKNRDEEIKKVSAVITFISLIFSTMLFFGFDKNTSQMQFIEKASWIPAFSINYFVGVDGLSMSMVFLTSLLSFLSVIASFNIKERVKEYFFFFLLLVTGMTGVFVALDFFLFYVFWEITLVPMYFLIGIWGGPRKEYAAIKFFLYTLFGSVIMLLGILALYFTSNPHTFNMLELAGGAQTFTRTFQLVVYAAMFIGFAIKVPVFPFHTWLPDAHVEAPTAVSVILAGVLLKMGTYGMLRISYTILPQATIYFALPLAILGLINIVYGAFVAMAQKDLKKMIAYSSVNHMGYVILGMATLTVTGINGAIFQMFNHGIITGALFLLVGVVYDRAHTRDIDAFGGLGSKLPVYTGIMVVACMASLGLPGLAGFISEFMCFLGAFPVYRIITIISLIGVVVTASYFLWMIQRVFLGKFNEKWNGLTDMNLKELVSVVPLIVIMIVLGIFPGIVLDTFTQTVTQLVSILK
jgi:NADH-quinone oxidoreductase subunit M